MEPDDVISCATYTHARRHPMVIGQIGGWTPPFQLSVAQVGVLLVSILAMTQLWRTWGSFLPSWLAVVLVVGVPAALTWSVRKARIEGRSLARTAIGWLAFLGRSRLGKVGGRAYQRSGRAVALGGARVFVATGQDRS